MSLRPQVKTPETSRSRPAAVRRGLRESPKVRLTPRESEVMRWVSEGKRDREIAIILGLSPRTVEKHVCHILEKLQVETRTAAVNECLSLANYSLGPPTRQAKALSNIQAGQQFKT